MLPGVPQQIQNPNVHWNVPNMDPETVRIRKFMCRKIFDLLMQRRQQPTRKLIEIVKGLEDGLFKSAMTMEEYLNLETLIRRLQILKRTRYGC